MEGMSRQFAKNVCYQKPYQHWFVIMSTENRPRLKSQLTNNVLSSFNFKPLVYTLRLNSNFVVPTHQWDQIRRFWKVLGSKVSCKSSSNILQQFRAIVKNCTFWATSKENWATYYSNIWSHCCYLYTTFSRENNGQVSFLKRKKASKCKQWSL